MTSPTMLRTRFITEPPHISDEDRNLSSEVQEEVIEKFDAMVAILTTYHPTVTRETAEARVRAILYTTYHSLGICDGPIEYDAKRARVLERVQKETETMAAMGQSIDANWSMKDIAKGGGEDDYDLGDGEDTELGVIDEDVDEDDEEVEEGPNGTVVGKKGKRGKGRVLAVGVNRQIRSRRDRGFTASSKGTGTE